MTFKDETGSVLCAAPQVDLVFAGDTTLGSASCDWSVTLSNNEDARPIEVTIVVDNYYIDTSDNETVIIVSKPGDGFITGGGYLVMSDSAGVYDGRRGHQIQLRLQCEGQSSQQWKRPTKGDVPRSLYGRPTGASTRSRAMPCFRSVWIWILMAMVTSDVEPHAAQFESKANLTDVTDPLNPISLGGNLLLQMRLTDNGEPGESDTISFTLWDDGACSCSHRIGMVLNPLNNLLVGEICRFIDSVTEFVLPVLLGAGRTRERPLRLATLKRTSGNMVRVYIWDWSRRGVT